MTVLTSAVAVGDHELHIDTALSAGQVPGYVKIDDELLEVGGQDNLAGTTLVLSTPAKEEHEDGATVTYAGRPYDPTFKMALTGEGGEQTIRLLGPYRVQHNTAGMTPNGAGAVVGDALPVGALVWAWPVLITGFNNAGTDAVVRVDLWWEHAGGVGVPGTLGELMSAVGVSGGYGEDSSSSGYPVQSSSFIGTNRSVPIPYRVISENVKLAIKLTGVDPGVPSAGIADIYALIAEPAS